jgi:SAM-dependent methyltransferase
VDNKQLAEMITLTMGEGKAATVRIPEEAKRLASGFNAVLQVPDGTEVRIEGGIIDTLGDREMDLTLAQRSNLVPVTAAMYEDTWRVRSIGILSGEAFPIEAETALLTEWLAPTAGEILLDLGCSTALYARALAKAAPDAATVAIDYARPMLHEARRRAIAAGIDLYLLRADCEHLPFANGSVGKAAIGGTLNEFRDPVKALYEARRVLRKDGSLFVMALREADTFAGRFLQKGAASGGITFWSASALSDLYERCGFRIRKRENRGIVEFALLG